MPKSRPIIFTADSISAIIDGRKTVTRRVIKWPGGVTDSDDDGWPMFENKHGEWLRLRCPYGQQGDLLWVRETFIGARGETMKLRYRADGELKNATWSSPIFMPRWASRLTLRVVDVRAERLSAITEEDAKREGCPECDYCERQYKCGQWGRGMVDDSLSSAAGGRPFHPCHGSCGGKSAMEWFAELWDSINAKRGHPFDSDPWVWRVEFVKTRS